MWLVLWIYSSLFFVHGGDFNLAIRVAVNGCISTVEGTRVPCKSVPHSSGGSWCVYRYKKLTNAVHIHIQNVQVPVHESHSYPCTDYYRYDHIPIQIVLVPVHAKHIQIQIGTRYDHIHIQRTSICVTAPI